jgi:outer membrane protein
MENASPDSRLAERPGLGYISGPYPFGKSPSLPRSATFGKPKMPRIGVYLVFLALLGAGCAPQGPLQAPQQDPFRLASTIERMPAEIPRAKDEQIQAAPGIAIESLEQAWAAAQTADRGLQAHHWNESAAEQATLSARAERWPVVGLESSYTGRTAEPSFKVYFEGLPLPPGTFPYEQSENFAGRATIDLPLYTGGRIEHGIAAAEADRAASALDTEDALMNLKMRVAEVYVTVLRAQRDVELTESTIRSLESHARDVEVLFGQGQVQQTDLLAAQVALANARCDGVQAKNRLDSSRAAYNRHVGRPLTAPVLLAELPLETPTSDLESLTSLALHSRPAIARLVNSVEALEHRAESVRAKNAPQVFARGEYDYEQDIYKVPEGIAAAGVGVTWNLFDGGRNRFEAKNLSEQAEAIRCRREELESLIALDVRRAWLDVQETRRRLEAAPEAIQQAEENLRVIRKRYSLGTATNTEVLDAETLRTQAYRNHDTAMYEAVLAVLRLRHAIGELRGGAVKTGFR